MQAISIVLQKLDRYQVKAHIRVGFPESFK